MKIVSRIIIYTWISLLFVLRSDLLIDIVYRYCYIYFSATALLAFVIAKNGGDIELIYPLLSREKYILFIYCIFILIWVQFGVEWISSVRPINYEAFMRYEPIAILAGMPVSILICSATGLYHLDDTTIEAAISWYLYFSASILQLHFFITKYKKTAGFWGRAIACKESDKQ